MSKKQDESVPKNPFPSGEILPIADPEAERAKENRAKKKGWEDDIKKAQQKIREINNGQHDQRMRSRGERMEAIKGYEYTIQKARKLISEL